MEGAGSGQANLILEQNKTMEGARAYFKADGIGEDSHAPGLPWGDWGYGGGSWGGGLAFVSCANSLSYSPAVGNNQTVVPREVRDPSPHYQSGSNPLSVSWAILKGNRSGTITLRS